MTGDRRKYRRDSAAHRREALMQATLALIAEAGLEAATVRAIAERADVTPGLIRHYFSTKRALMLAAYDHHMTRMTEDSFDGIEDGIGERGEVGGEPERLRLVRFVTRALEPPVTEPAAVALWAGFIAHVRRDAEMRAIHARTYHAFRDRFEGLIAAALEADGRPVEKAARRHLAIACNGVIDGLWLEGGALPDTFAPGELAGIGRRAVGAILGLDLDTGYEPESQRGLT